MSAPIQRKWSGQVAGTANLNSTTHGSGTTAQRTPASPWPTDRPWFDTTIQEWYYNSNVEATPVWDRIGSLNQDLTYVTSQPTDASSTDLDLWFEKIRDGNLYQFNQNLTTKAEAFPPVNWWSPITALGSPVKKLGDTTLIFDDDFTQYTSDATLNNIWNGGITPAGDHTNNRFHFNEPSTGSSREMSVDLQGKLHSTDWVLRTNIDIIDKFNHVGSPDLDWFFGLVWLQY